MMTGLAEIYDRSFFEEWGPGHENYIQSARTISRIIYQQFNPSSLSDIGCGCGVYSDWFQKKGVTVFAYDGVRPPADLSFNVDINTMDITDPAIHPLEKTDLAICFEVAEHLPEEFSDVFARNLGKFSDRVLLSAAPPGQGGHHHVNERPKRYWVQKLAEAGFVYNRKATGRFVEAFKKSDSFYKWMGEHVSFYEKISDKTPIRQDLPFQTRLA